MTGLVKGKAKTPDGSSDSNALLVKTLLSLGAERNSVETLASSNNLNDIVIPIYWKDGLVSSVRPLWLIKLPEFLKTFQNEFPDGQIRWDQDFQSNDQSLGDIALRVYFNYQEDDQGDHWSPPPTLLEEESYYRMLSRGSFKGKRPVAAAKVVHEK